ncbi:MAG: RNA-binding transcriptional accessory protein [Okeania sp. SIO3I5]|uniref:Tex family protein n=1 Tax=Okeania sp. SIO3I5 TaxID=2607805 RepID=UPI0013BAAF7F|nr:Tex family protein [Okeania sp. SIO3I5]NEQ40908.1 RNA-binding transcriptional accessory protein [Okeania sp. SIO3I5]
MLDINKTLAQELNINPKNIKNALELLNGGATIPFVARYRKEYTGSLDETQLRNIWDRFTYLQELEERKKVILKAISEAGKLTEELQEKIESCLQKTELEDLYLPYKAKRRTRATIAREKGLEPLAEFIKSLNHPQAKIISIEEEAVKYIYEEKGVKNLEDAIQGASDILAEAVAEKAELRAYIREYFLKKTGFSSKIKDDYPEGTTKFEMYRNFQVNVKDIAPHNMLALLRGETEGILNLELDFDREFVLSYLADSEIRTRAKEIRNFYQEMLKDAFNRLMKNSLINEVRTQKKAEADIESIKTFETNLRELLLSAPAGMKPTLGIDPGFRTGCKVAVLGETGKFLEYQAIFPHQSTAQKQKATTTIQQLIQKYKIELIAIGNGTAGRETDEFITEVISTFDKKPIKVMVNESGASIYSASKVAIEEFPDLDITVRGAISIGRRLQDPLAELVKIEPKSIGVGQYQHDVDQKLLKKKLDETVESCVNYVGVDLNTASKELLIFVSGMSSTVAKNLVKYRNENGAFQSRQEILKVSKLGGKTFELCAGFLRIRSGENPLDNTAVHPESYSVVEAIAQELGVSINQINEISKKVKSLDLKKYVTDKIGEPTLKDIIGELEKPGRDPRAEFKYATFREGIKEISDLEVGMQLEGIVTNVANFGAFVDVGVHQDGLVHISQLADYFVKDPKQVVKVGQVVKVRVLEVNEKLKRIGLSMKNNE